jgi:hypothetical protein
MNGKEAQIGGLSVTDAQIAVREFLEKAVPGQRLVNETKVAKHGADEGDWEAEADVWQPNPTVQALHLETQRPVLDQCHYLVRLDALLNVVAYELAQGTEP